MQIRGIKRGLLLGIALLLMMASAGADEYRGRVIAADPVNITAPATGILESMQPVLGQRVTKGEVLGNVGVASIFADQDGIVSRISAAEGESVTAAEVLSVTSLTPYEIYCSVKGAYDEELQQEVHCGETLWIACRQNGSHKAKGRVTAVNNQEFRVVVEAGELYVGEAVWLYRTEEKKETGKVGYGTVVAAEETVYQATGYLTRLNVQEQQRIEKGKLLYCVSNGEEQQILSPANGTITALTAVQGNGVSKNMVIGTIAAGTRLSLTVNEADLADFSRGQAVTFFRADDPEETPLQGTVESIAHVSTSTGYEVRIRPEDMDLPIGMTVTVESGK